jgi:zinc transporter 9
MADGVALGSTCYASQGKDTTLPFVIFMALLLHKCPAAIGLTTFLRHENLGFSKILCHLTAFTSTSPI